MIKGHFYDAHSSARHDAWLAVESGEYTVHCHVDGADKSIMRGAVEDVSLSPRIAGVPTRLQWTEGSVFETNENAAVDMAFGRRSFLHKLESNWKAVFVSFATIAMLAFSLFKWGIPSASRHVAVRLPVEVHEGVSKGALETLDKFLFVESELDVEIQAEIDTRFNKLVATLGDTPFDYRLSFRNMGGIANAMALPSGQIVVTDALVEMASVEELDAVLLHELGHVEHRHGMTQVLSAAATSVVVTTAMGDVGAINELATGVPVFLMRSNYSRAHENEADTFAFEQMARAGIDPIHFATIIRKLGASAGSEGINEYFSTHPATELRAQRAAQASSQFRPSLKQ